MDSPQCWHHSETTSAPKIQNHLHSSAQPRSVTLASCQLILSPEEPGFEEAKWIMSEDVNVEHLLDVFTSTDADSNDVWDTCAYFMEHLYWHKPRLVMLGPKFEGLPDDQPSKPKCLYQLSRLFRSVGNYVEYKRLLGHTLELWRGQGDKFSGCFKALECLAAGQISS
jgi:hypothetical protein